MALPYRTRQFLKRSLQVLVALVLVAVVIWAMWMLWLDRYVVYTRDGARLDFSYSSKDLTGEPAVPPQERDPVSIYYNEGDNSLNTSLELSKVTGYYIDVDMMIDEMDDVRSQLRKLPAGTPVLVDVKDIQGRFFYSTGLGPAHPKLDPKDVDSLIRELVTGDLYVIARFPAFRDYYYSVEHVNQGIASSKGAYLYLDDSRCYWLNPTNSGAQSFVMQIITELRDLGFDEVVLSDFCFPDSEQIHFSGDRDKAIAAAAKVMSAAATDRFAVSFVAKKPSAFVMPEGRGRMYLEDRLAEDAKSLAESSGIENTEVNLIFITELLDTRFDAYGVIRPINAVELDDL